MKRKPKTEKRIDVTVTHLAVDSIVALLPNHLAGGEPGTPLDATTQKLIRGFAAAGYWPLDFGEGHATHGELVFVPGNNVKDAKKCAEHFMKAGGYV